MLSTISEALASTEFLIGLRNGAVALFVALAPVLVRSRSTPVAAGLWVVASAAGLWTLGAAPSALVAGLVLLLLAGGVHPYLRSLPWVRLLIATPGAWLISWQSGLEGLEWVAWAVLIAVVLAGPLTAAAEDHLEPRGVSLLMWVVTVGGVFGTVPDTEGVLVLLGAATFLMVLGVCNLTRFGAAGAYAAVGLLAWVAAMGGIGRPASIVGALACLGAFLLAPVAPRIRSHAVASWPIVLVTHVVVVAIGSRVAGLRTSVVEASLIAGGGLLLGMVALVVAARRVTAPDSSADAS